MSNNEELGGFLREQCRQRGLTLRSLSLRSGLSPGAVHSIITRKHKTSISSLNRLADYLGIKRQCLWQLAGLLEGTDYADETSDLQHFEASDNVSKAKQTQVTIAIFKETKDGLDFIKRSGQTCDGVIQELIEFWKRQQWGTTRVSSSVKVGQEG